MGWSVRACTYHTVYIFCSYSQTIKKSGVNSVKTVVRGFNSLFRHIDSITTCKHYRCTKQQVELRRQDFLMLI